MPTLNGHVIGQNKEYIAPPQEARDIVEWFEKHDIKKIDMIAGASLGAYVASEVLRLRPDFAEYALIESLKCYHYGSIMTQIFSVLGEKCCVRQQVWKESWMVPIRKNIFQMT